MPNLRSYHCPYEGCSQTSTRRWNMQIHIRRKHTERRSEMPGNNGHSFIPTGYQPTFSQNQRRAAGIHSQYLYEPPYKLNISADKAAETSLYKTLETTRTFNESLRLLNDYRNAAADPSSEIAKLLMVQTLNLFRGKGSNPAKKETLPAGYRISLCDTCLSGWESRPVSYPIELEGITKLNHKCDTSNIFVGLNEEEILRIKCQAKGLLENYILNLVRSRIGQRDACLKALKLSRQVFSEEVRKKFKLPANRSLIEEKDSIKINLLCDSEAVNRSWFCRVIKEAGKNNSVSINQYELTEFLRIARSTFGVFHDVVKKDYFLIYLVL
jgi:hypothetical protein